MSRVRLNSIIYAPGSGLSATVTIDLGEMNHELPVLIVSAPHTKDVEALRLRRTGDPSVFVTDGEITLELPGSAVVAWDRRLSVRPNEIFIAMYFTPAKGRGHQRSDMVFDFGLMEDEAFRGSPVKVTPQIAMSDDEAPVGGKRIGTVVTEGGLPVQLPVAELIVYPRDEQELKQILRDTRGQIVRSMRTRKPSAQVRTAYLVRVNTEHVKLNHLPQMRALMGETETLHGSSADVLRIYALAMLYRLDGIGVAVNPRLQFMGAPATVDGPLGGGSMDAISSASATATPIFADNDTSGSLPADLFGVRTAWAYTALWDKDTQRIPVAILDYGFAPNWDFRAASDGAPGEKPGPFLMERSIAHNTSGPGSAVAPPTVGNSLFGNKSWHGTGVATVCGGVLNNGWGSAGTGGQVVRPMLYEMGLAEYAFEVGEALMLATDDGAAVINLSAGYPCVIVSNVGASFNICDPLGLLTLCETVAATAILAATVAAAAAVGVCAAAGWIPFVGQAACAIAVTAAGVAAVAAGAAVASCLALFPVAELLWDPMQEGVDYALSRGVPVVSISGNNSNFASAVVASGPQDAGKWQVIPCVMNGVICVGAADNVASFSNQHYFGDRVDIWAPIRARYFAPPEIDQVGTVDLQEPQSPPLGGTSAAAPYITGIIAMMQAVNPKLNPLTAGLMPAERSAIPPTIRALLKDTATTKAMLTLAGGGPNDPRRNLVNALAAVKAAARLPGQEAVPDFESSAPSLGFTSLGFDETSNTSDSSATAETITLLPGSDATARFGAILTIPADAGPGGTTFLDQDWFVWKSPSAIGVHKGGVVRLTQPLTTQWGTVRVNDQFGSLFFQDGLIEVREFAIPDLFEDSCFPLKLSGEGLTDNPYKLALFPGDSVVPPPPADPFDDPATNPVGQPHNDAPGTAAGLGTGAFAWKDLPLKAGEIVTKQFAEIKVTGLNFHRKGDEDWFTLSLPPGWEPADCGSCHPKLTITTAPGVTTQIWGANANPAVDPPLIVSESPSVAIGCNTYAGQFPLKIRFTSTPPSKVPLPSGCSNVGGPVSYDLTLRWTVPSIDFCNLKIFVDIKVLYPETDLKDPSIPMCDPPPCGTDPFGRVINANRYVVDWRGGEIFRLQARLVEGQSIALQLLDVKGSIVAEASTSDLLDQFRLATAPLEQAGIVTLTLEAPELPPGTYILSMSHGRMNTQVEVLLPRNATGNGLLSLEDRLRIGGPLREILRPIRE